jgi:hypothetical protein
VTELQIEPSKFEKEQMLFDERSMLRNWGKEREDGVYAEGDQLFGMVNEFGIQRILKCTQKSSIPIHSIGNPELFSAMSLDNQSTQWNLGELRISSTEYCKLLIWSDHHFGLETRALINPNNIKGIFIQELINCFQHKSTKSLYLEYGNREQDHVAKRAKTLVKISLDLKRFEKFVHFVVRKKSKKTSFTKV